MAGKRSVVKNENIYGQTEQNITETIILFVSHAILQVKP
jgi:hypothetical protein